MYCTLWEVTLIPLMHIVSVCALTESVQSVNFALSPTAAFRKPETNSFMFIIHQGAVAVYYFDSWTTKITAENRNPV